MGPYLQVGGQWEMRQSNGYRVAVNIMQTGDRLTASASHSAGRVQSRKAEGFVNGTYFELTIEWNNGSRGLYSGEFSHGPFTPPPIGYLKGSTKDLDHTWSTATWESEGKNFQFA